MTHLVLSLSYFYVLYTYVRTYIHALVFCQNNILTIRQSTLWIFWIILFYNSRRHLSFVQAQTCTDTCNNISNAYIYIVVLAKITLHPYSQMHFIYVSMIYKVYIKLQSDIKKKKEFFAYIWPLDFWANHNKLQH